MLQQSAPDVNAILLPQELSYVGTENDDRSKIKCANLLHAFHLIIETRKLMKKHKVCKSSGELEIYHVEHYFQDYVFCIRCSKCMFKEEIFSTTNPYFYKGAEGGVIISNCLCDFTSYICDQAQNFKEWWIGTRWEQQLDNIRDMLPELTKHKTDDLKCANVLHSLNLIKQVMIYVAQHDQDCNAGGELTFQISQHRNTDYDFHFKCSKTCTFKKAFWSSTDPMRHPAAVYGTLTCACFFPMETDSSNPSQTKNSGIDTLDLSAACKAQNSTTISVPNGESSNDDSSLHKENGFYLQNHFLPGPITLLRKNRCVINYNHMTRIPNYVMEVLTDSTKESDLYTRKSIDYEEDDEIPEKFRSTLADYKGSGFDKGHITPALYNKCHRQCFGDSCLLSNVAPQDHSMNSGVWEDLEKSIYKRSKETHMMRICSGPLFTTSEEGGKKYRKFEVIGPNEVAVPPKFFKVLNILHDTGIRELECYVVPNKKEENKDDEKNKFDKYLVSRDYLSKVAGFEIFGDVKDDSFHVINKKTRE